MSRKNIKSGWWGGRYGQISIMCKSDNTQQALKKKLVHFPNARNRKRMLFLFCSRGKCIVNLNVILNDFYIFQKTTRTIFLKL